jgi:tRNA-binding EMAP/Myf-like protein
MLLHHSFQQDTKPMRRIGATMTCPKLMSFLSILCFSVAMIQSADGYQLKRSPSFLGAPQVIQKSKVMPTITTTSSSSPSSPPKQSINSKRSYRNDATHQEESHHHDESHLVAPTAEKTKRKRRLQSPLIVRRKPKATVRTVDELRHAILDQRWSLSDIAIVHHGTDNEELDVPASIPTDFFHNHAVRELILQRYQQQSMPGHRSINDTAILALSIEGGGMRGCVSAGMVAAIASLGLSDTIDRVYGSSAGSVVGAYFISRQVCMDVYVDILPAAKTLFVCKNRMIRSLASSVIDILVNNWRKESASNINHNSNNTASLLHHPGMNISFVLDGIMGQDHGIRPLDMETFQQNDAKQPLRVVSSIVDPETGRLYSKCFGTRDFFNVAAVKKTDGSRRGLFACLEASMTVPVCDMND